MFQGIVDIVVIEGLLMKRDIDETGHGIVDIVVIEGLLMRSDIDETGHVMIRHE
ncbi:hypothetical protein Tco_0186928, partial [Tanacetum coccineum]